MTAFFACCAPAASAQNAHVPTFAREVKHDVSPRLAAMPMVPEPSGEQEHEVRMVPRRFLAPHAYDLALQTSPGSAIVVNSGANFEGTGIGLSGFTMTGAPPDTNGAAGLTQYVQWVNSEFTVFNKSTGAVLLGPMAGNSLWTGFGGGCESTNDGDPIVQYDKLANRWILTQFSVSGGSYLQCIAVSKTSDATGQYNRYAFQYANGNDYPKLSVWPDAYYITYNMFTNFTKTGTFLGATVCAMDRAAMLNGTAATQVCFSTGTSYGALLTSDLDGPTPPPAGSPNYVLTYDGNTSSNWLDLWKFHVDFVTPGNSTLSGPVTIPVANFTEACSGGTCIPQTNSGQNLDSLGDRPMYRLAYRNFGDHEALVVNHSVNVSGTVGVRWYEIRNPGGTPQLYQQGTFSPDSSYRWMGSIAMDGAGNMALGYSVSSSTLHPSIRYTGRAPTDALGTMGAENSIIAGTGSQLPNLSRWGDYSSMSLDPTDDCTFWYTNEYLTANGTFNWRTRIASFKFPNCGAPAITSIQPSSGPSTGGTAVTIGGSNFVSGATVSFGGSAASNVSVSNSTTITATTPAKSGQVDVVVTNPSGQSATAAGGYTFVVTPAATPAFNPPAGAYIGGQSVSITTATAGATIYYTLDGTTPSSASTVYTGPVTVSASKTLKAIAVAAGYTTSSVGSADYSILTRATLPQSSFSVLAADSQETGCYNGAASNAIDGNPSTFWVTQFCGVTTAMPHDLRIDLGTTYPVAGFRYLPRQDGSSYGDIRDYEFYVSADGSNWGSPVTSGTLITSTTDAAEKLVTFPVVNARYVRLRALTEVSGNPWAVAAELNVLTVYDLSGPFVTGVTLTPTSIQGGNTAQGTVTLSAPAPASGAAVALSSTNRQVATVPTSVSIGSGSTSANFVVTTTSVSTDTQLSITGVYNGAASKAAVVTVPAVSASLIPQSGWSLLSVDSQETGCYNGAASNAFDGNPSTMWVTEFCTSAPGMPHDLRIDLGSSYSLSAFRYLPRQDSSASGNIASFDFYVSADGVNWGAAVASGALMANTTDNTVKQVNFSPVTGRYVRLRALSEVYGSPWAVVAELNLLGASASSSGGIVSVTATPASVVGIAGSQGTVTLGAPAPAGGAAIALASSDTQTVAVPSKVIVPAGATTANFAITTWSVPASTTATITATYAGTATTTVTVTTAGAGSAALARAGWSVLFVDSQETGCYNGAAANSFDGNSATMWVTQYCGVTAPMPHDLRIDLGATYALDGFKYLPRQDNSYGDIRQYEFYVSADGVNWSTPVAAGYLINTLTDTSEKTITFSPVSARYVRLRALSEVNGNPWTVAPELNVLGH